MNKLFMLIIQIVSAVICSMLAMRMNTRRMIQRTLDMICAKYGTTGYVADGTIEHSAFTCSG